jgi:hypothetical protein
MHNKGLTMNYRKIWEEHNGTIPKDENGISFEIHHIDGNRDNNDIANLACISIVDHFNIHYSQSDYLACLLIAKRINDYANGVYDKELLSSIATRINKIRLENGTHNFIQPNHINNNKVVQKKLFKEGKHHFCVGQDERGKLSFLKKQKSWTESSEDEFFNTIKNYKFYVEKKLRSGVVENVLNGIIMQAINCRYKNVDDKNKFFRKLVEYHNVNETYIFCEQQEQYIKRRSRERTAKRLGLEAR